MTKTYNADPRRNKHGIPILEDDVRIPVPAFRTGIDAYAELVLLENGCLRADIAEAIEIHDTHSVNGFARGNERLSDYLHTASYDPNGHYDKGIEAEPGLYERLRVFLKFEDILPRINERFKKAAESLWVERAQELTEKLHGLPSLEDGGLSELTALYEAIDYAHSRHGNDSKKKEFSAAFTTSVLKILEDSQKRKTATLTLVDIKDEFRNAGKATKKRGIFIDAKLERFFKDVRIAMKSRPAPIAEASQARA